MRYHEESAEARHQRHLEQAAQSTETIREWLQEQAKLEHVDWGHVGTAWEVIERLKEIKAFIGK